MTHEDKIKLYTALSAPFPESCVQRTDGHQTGRGYSTTGIAYQFVVNRLNDVVGLGGFRAERTMTTREMTSAKGRPVFEAICELKLQLGEWQDGKFVPFAEAIGDGGHTSVSMADAIKGAFTNGFKKAAAFFGCGRQAYEGTLDEDSIPDEPRVDDGFRTPSPAALRGVAPPPGAATRYSAAPAAAPTPRLNTQLATPSQSPPLAEPPAATPAQSPQLASNGATPPRNRLTSKQLGALWAISKRLGYEQRDFRGYTREMFGVQPEFLTRDQASQMITTMGNGANSNGAGASGSNGNGHEQAGRIPGAEG